MSEYIFTDTAEVFAFLDNLLDRTGPLGSVLPGVQSPATEIDEMLREGFVADGLNGCTMLDSCIPLELRPGGLDHGDVAATLFAAHGWGKLDWTARGSAKARLTDSGVSC